MPCLLAVPIVSLSFKKHENEMEWNEKENEMRWDWDEMGLKKNRRKKKKKKVSKLSLYIKICRKKGEKEVEKKLL